MNNNDIDKIESLFKEFLDKHKNILGISFDKNLKEEILITEEQISEFQTHLNDSLLTYEQFKDYSSSFLRKLRMKTLESIFVSVDDYCINLANKLGKKIKFEIIGKDKLIPNEYLPLFHDLIHAFRNSIDHGIEKPSERLKLGKAKEGKLTLDVSEDINFFRIIIKDDGKGIDENLLVKKAIENNIISNEQANKMSKEEKLLLAFKSGLSTAKKVTEISGRGMGLSAIYETTVKLGGKLNVDSEFNKGIKLSIELPKISYDKKNFKIAS